MLRGAESLTDRIATPRRDLPGVSDARAPQPGRTLPQAPPADPAQEARARLILRLAGDRLRELRDDGVTFGYIARIYGVDAAEITRLHDELVGPRGL